MPRIGQPPARHANRSRGHYRRTGNHHRLRQVGLECRWKIICLSAAQSCSTGIGGSRRRREAGSVAPSRESVWITSKPNVFEQMITKKTKFLPNKSKIFAFFVSFCFSYQCHPCNPRLLDGGKSHL